MAGSKRKYIEATYQLLVRDGLEGLSSRKVAAECGCSNAALYKHFADIDELIAISSVRFLKEYGELGRFLSQVDLNPLELNLQLWECLAFYSFQQAPIFQNLFFSKSNQGAVGHMLTSYYEEFPEDIADLKDYMIDMFSGATMLERDKILLDRARDMGMISDENVDLLCKLDTYLYRGMLSAACETYKQPEKARAMTQDFMRLVISNYQHALEPGFSILVVNPDYSTDKPNERGPIKLYQVFHSRTDSPEDDGRQTVHLSDTDSKAGEILRQTQANLESTPLRDIPSKPTARR